MGAIVFFIVITVVVFIINYEYCFVSYYFNVTKKEEQKKEKITQIEILMLLKTHTQCMSWKSLLFECMWMRKDARSCACDCMYKNYNDVLVWEYGEQ